MADRFPLILNTSANQIQEIGSGDQLDLSGNNIANAGIITAGNVTIGAATTDLIVKGDARITGILTIGTSSLKLDGPNNLVNVGTALTLGHTQGLQFHTQNLHSAGFEVNQINASGIITATGADINGDLDVDGHTNLDNVNVSGATTTTGVVVINGATQSTNSTSGALRVAGGAGIAKNVNVGGDLDVDGHTNLDNVNVAGVTTFSNNIDVNGNADISGQLVVGANSTISGDLTLSDQQPRLYFIDNAGSPNNPDYLFQVDGGTFLLHDSTNVADRFSVAANGHIRSHSNHDFSAGIDVTGNATVSGNLSVGGVLTYEDVTNVDSVGIITARAGINLTGGDITLGDSAGPHKLKFGAGADFQLFHNGSNNYIDVAGNGHLYIRPKANFYIQDYTNGEVWIDGTLNGGVKLYNNGIKKFETDGNGITVQGNINMATDSTLQLGVGNDFKLFHNGTTNYIRSANGNIQIDNNSGVVNAKFIPGGASELYHNGTKMLETTSIGLTISGDVKIIDNENLRLGNDNDMLLYHTGSHGYIENATGNMYIRGGGGQILMRANSSEDAVVIIPDGSVELYHDGTKRLETTGSGVEIPQALFVGEKIDMPDHTSGTNGMILLGTGDDLYMYHDGTNSHLRNNTGTFNIRSTNFRLTDAALQHVYLKTNDSGNNDIQLYYDNNVKLATTSSGVTVTGTINFGSGMGSGLNSNGFNINFADSNGSQDMAKFGDSGDLKIYHQSNSSYIINSTGNLNIGSNNEVRIKGGSDVAEMMIKCVDNGAVELYYDGTKKFETFSGGVRVDGELLMQNYHLYLNDNAKLRIGTGQDFNIFHDGTDNIFQSSGLKNFVFKPKDTDIGLKIKGDNGVELYYDNAKHFETTSFGAQTVYSSGGGSVPIFKVLHGNLSQGVALGYNTVAAIGGNTNVELNLESQGTLPVRLRTDGSVNMIEAYPGGEVRLNYNGSIAARTYQTGSRKTFLVGDQSHINASIDHGELIVRRNLGSPNNASIEQCARMTVITNEQTAGGNGYGGAVFFGAQDVSNSSQYTYRLAAIGAKLHNSADLANTTPNGDLSFFCQNSSLYERGRLRHDGYLFLTNTSIQSLSDVRLKENIEDYSFDLDKFKQFKPVTFNWKKPEYHSETPKSGKHRGFIAQDVQKLDSYALVNEYDLDKDSEERELIDEDGVGLTSTLGDKDAMYVSVIQQLIDKIEKLETEVDALKGS